MRLYIDCDGVLTDGRLTINEHGIKLFKQFHHRDVDAIRELISAGWEVTIITADDWYGIERFAHKVGAFYLFTRDKGDLIQPYYAIGDSLWDVEMLVHAEAAYCPANASRHILNIPTVTVLETFGGLGVIDELAGLLLAP